MQESKSCALPLGDSPSNLYSIKKLEILAEMLENSLTMLNKICNNNAVWQFCCTSYTHLFDMYGLFFTSMQKTYLTDAAPTAFEVV